MTPNSLEDYFPGKIANTGCNLEQSFPKTHEIPIFVGKLPISVGTNPNFWQVKLQGRPHQGLEALLTLKRRAPLLSQAWLLGCIPDFQMNQVRVTVVTVGDLGWSGEALEKQQFFRILYG